MFHTHSKVVSPQRPNGYIGPIDLLSISFQGPNCTDLPKDE